MDRIKAARVVGIIATVLLFYAANPWIEPPERIVHVLVIYGFWASFIVLLVLLFQERKLPGGETVEIEGPAFARFLFSNTRAGLFWLPIRLFLGFSGSKPATTSSPVRAGSMAAPHSRATGPTPSTIPERRGPAADHLRVVPRLHQTSARRRSRDLVRLAHHLR